MKRHDYHLHQGFRQHGHGALVFGSSQFRSWPSCPKKCPVTLNVVRSGTKLSYCTRFTLNLKCTCRGYEHMVIQRSWNNPTFYLIGLWSLDDIRHGVDWDLTQGYPVTLASWHQRSRLEWRQRRGLPGLRPCPRRHQILHFGFQVLILQFLDENLNDEG